MRHPFSPVLLSTLGLLLLVSCKAPEQVYGPDEALGGNSSIILDSSLKTEERALVKSDLNRLLNLQVGTLEMGGNFSQIFNGTSMPAAIQYLNERVKLIVSERVVLENRMAPANRKQMGALMEQKQSLEGLARSLLGNTAAQTIDPAPDTKPKAVMMALNMSPVLWFIAQTAGVDMVFKTQTQSLPILSSRVGVVQLGEGYMMNITPRGRPITIVERMDTFIHEARHSDCTGGLKRSILTDLATADRDSTVERWTHESTCGHPHIACPEGHSLAGIPACDNHAWGPYAIGGFFDMIIVNKCTNCSEEEKQAGLVSGTDSLMRLALSKAMQTNWDDKQAVDDVAEMLKGNMGKPDMTSSGVIEDQ